MTKYKSSLEIAKILHGTFVDRKKKIMWFGSGLSNAYPSWPKLIRDLCEKCEVSEIDSDKKFDDKSEILLKKAQECKNNNQRIFENHLASEFGHPLGTRNAYYQALTLDIDFFITTNFDPCLFDASQNNINDFDVYYYPNIDVSSLSNSNKTIFYIHGIALKNGEPNGKNLLLAQNDFDIAYSEPYGPLTTFLGAILMGYSFIFFGCELSEKYFEQIFKNIVRVQSILISQGKNIDDLPEKYIVFSRIRDDEHSEPLSENERKEHEKNRLLKEKEREDKLNKMGIKVLWYNPKRSSHHYEIEKIFEIWQALYQQTDEQIIGIETGANIPI